MGPLAGREQEEEPPGYPQANQLPHTGGDRCPSAQEDAAGGQMAMHPVLALHMPPSHPGVNKGLTSRVTLSWLVLWGWEQGGILTSGASRVWGRREGQEPPLELSPGGLLSPFCTVPRHVPTSSRLLQTEPRNHPCP